MQKAFVASLKPRITRYSLPMVLAGFWSKIMHSFELSSFREKNKDAFESNRWNWVTSYVILVCKCLIFWTHNLSCVTHTATMSKYTLLKLCSMPSSCNILTFQFVQNGAQLYKILSFDIKQIYFQGIFQTMWIVSCSLSSSDSCTHLCTIPHMRWNLQHLPCSKTISIYFF